MAAKFAILASITYYACEEELEGWMDNSKDVAVFIEKKDNPAVGDEVIKVFENSEHVFGIMGICKLANTPFHLFLGLATYEYGISTQHRKFFPNEHSDKKQLNFCIAKIGVLSSTK